MNRQAKYLLLQHAFELLRCERVEFKTDVLNTVARKGLRNIGLRRRARCAATTSCLAAAAAMQSTTAS
jgi:RimJ/RimL family protein N-acetyltransferase